MLIRVWSVFGWGGRVGANAHTRTGVSPVRGASAAAGPPRRSAAAAAADGPPGRSAFLELVVRYRAQGVIWEEPKFF